MGWGECELFQVREGYCAVVACNKPLPPRRRRWCSDYCSRTYTRHHMWSAASKAARRRDGWKCVKCGSPRNLEVNHIIPRNGAGYGDSCAHHLDKLETLCHNCHVVVTAEQARERRQSALGD